MKKPWFDEEYQKQFGTGQRKQRQGEKRYEAMKRDRPKPTSRELFWATSLEKRDAKNLSIQTLNVTLYLITKS